MFGLRFRFQYVYKSNIFDFYCPKIKLVIEVDYRVGASHQSYYQARDSRLQAESIFVLRYKNDMLMEHFRKVAGDINDQVYKILQIKRGTKNKPLKQDPIPVPSLERSGTPVPSTGASGGEGCPQRGRDRVRKNYS